MWMYRRICFEQPGNYSGYVWRRQSIPCNCIAPDTVTREVTYNHYIRSTTINAAKSGGNRYGNAKIRAGLVGSTR